MTFNLDQETTKPEHFEKAKALRKECGNECEFILGEAGIDKLTCQKCGKIFS